MRASADSTPSPTGSLVAEPETDQPADTIGQGYFQLAMSGGQQRSVRLTVGNTSTEPITVRAYPVDAVPSTGGGIDFTTFDKPVTGAGAWVSVDSPNLELAPGESRRLTATIALAANATVGDHVAGIAVENARPRESGSDSQISISVFYRRAIAVVVSVPGKRTTALEVDAVVLSQDARGSRAVVQVRNTGNSLFKARGTLEISGNQASGPAQAFSVDTLIPGTGVGVEVALPSLRLSPGTYGAHVIMQAQDDGHALADWRGSAAFGLRPPAEPTAVPATAVSLAPVQAQPAAAVTVTEQVVPPPAATLSDQDAAAITHQAAATDFAGFWLVLILGVLLVALRIVLGILVRRRREASQVSVDVRSGAGGSE